MIKKHYEFSLWLRLTHWTRAISIIILTATGFYIAVPVLAPALNAGEPVNFLNALFRSWHVIFGFVLICITIGKFYLFFFDKESKPERASFKDFISPKVWIQQLKYYMLIDKHPHARGVYNPLQFVSYVAVYGTILVISLTGIMMYVHVFHAGLGGFFYDIVRPLEVLMGGLAVVREVHHLAMWVFIIFLPIHIYMAVFNSVYGKSGAMDSIISGYRWIDKK